MSVPMHGPAFDGSGRLVDRLVPKEDVRAYRNAGYRDGELPDNLRPLPASDGVITGDAPKAKRPKKGDE